MQKRTILALVTLIVAFISIRAQEPQPQTPPPPVPSPSVVSDDDVVRINTNLVQIDAVVTRGGKPVPNLKPEDFEIFEDGHKQVITTFTYVNNVNPSQRVSTVQPVERDRVPFPAPVHPYRIGRIIAMVVDDLGTSAESMASIRKQLRKFVNEELQPNDVVAIIRTGGDVGALQQFTNDRRVLNSAVDQLRWNLCSRVGPSVFLPFGGLQSVSARNGVGGEAMSAEELAGNCGYGSVSATLKSLTFIMRSLGQLQGRKAMVIFSDSIPRQEQEIDGGAIEFQLRRMATLTGRTNNIYIGLERLAEIAIRNSVVIYSVDTQGLQYTGPTAVDSFSGTSAQVARQMSAVSTSRSDLLWYRREGAELLANETGGFLVRNSNSFRLPEILDDQQGYYLIGYRPAYETFDKKFHHIKVQAKGSGLKTRTRKGFYGVSEEEVQQSSGYADKTLLALSSPFLAHDINVDLVALFLQDSQNVPQLRAFLMVPARDLTFIPQPDGNYKTDFEVRGVLFGNNGVVVSAVTFSTALTLKQNAYQQAAREGLSMHFDFAVKRPGAYQFRVAVKDVASTKIGSAGQFVAIPNLANKRLAMSGVLVLAASGQDQRQLNLDSPAVRRFRPNSDLLFAANIYNATVDTASGKPRISIEPRLFHEGKVVNSSKPLPLQIVQQSSFSRIPAQGVIHLASDLEPGKYFLQLIIRDEARPDKGNEVTQWIDFEIVGPSE